MRKLVVFLMIASAMVSCGKKELHPKVNLMSVTFKDAYVHKSHFPKYPFLLDGSQDEIGLVAFSAKRNCEQTWHDRTYKFTERKRIFFYQINDHYAELGFYGELKIAVPEGDILCLHLVDHNNNIAAHVPFLDHLSSSKPVNALFRKMEEKMLHNHK